MAALLLPLAAVAGAAAQAATPAAAATAPWHFPNPSIAAYGGQQFVFWKGANGGLWEAYNDGSWHGPIGFPRMGTLGSPPSVTVSPATGDQDVVWQGTDGNLWFACWNGSSWYGPSNLHMGQIGGRPDISSDAQGHLRIVWKGANSALWYASNASACPSATGGWSGPYSLGDGPLGSAPSVTYVTDSLDVAWAGTAPQTDLWYQPGGSPLQHVGMGPLDSPPSLVAPFGGGSREAFWAGTNGNLWFGQWTYLSLTNTLSPPHPVPGQAFQCNGQGLGPLGSAPGAAFNGSTYYVVWQGKDNNLWEATFNLGSSCWNLGVVPKMGPL